MVGEMRVLGKEGDLKVIWDSNNEDEVETARKQFNDLKKKGYVAFKVKKKGEAGERMDEFDADSEKMIMVPQPKGG